MDKVVIMLFTHSIALMADLTHLFGEMKKDRQISFIIDIENKGIHFN